MNPPRAPVAYGIAMGLILFAGLDLLLQSTILLAGGAVTPVALALALVASCVFCWGHSNGRRDAIVCIAGLLGLLLLFAVISTLFYDLSYDGQWYHQEAVGNIARGWNPYWSPDLSATAAGSGANRINEYPKGFWIVAAGIANTLGRIESGKIFGWIFCTVSLLLTWVLLSQERFRSMSPSRRLALSVAVAANPVVVVQLFTFLVDGQVASLITAALLLLILTAIGVSPQWSVAGFGLAVLQIIDLKHTGLYYAFFLYAAFAAWWFVSGKRGGISFRTAIIPFVLGLIAFGVVGFDPYIRNLKAHHNPIYPVEIPLVGDQAIDPEWNTTLTLNRPADYNDWSKSSMLFRSVFSFSDNTTTAPTRLKIPFQVERAETHCFTVADCRIGGFGPWFSAALTVAALTLILGIARSAFERATRDILIISTGILLISVLGFPESWAARFVPHLWLVPAGIAIAAIGLSLESAAVVRRLGWIIAAILLCNAASVAAINFRWQVMGTAAYKRKLDYQANQPRPVPVNLEPFRSQRFKLEERGIPYIDVKKGESTPWI
jgi:hypothetical protein